MDERINGFAQVEESTTYGVEVPGADGRAGMSSVVLSCGVEAFDAEGLTAHLLRELPGYAMPMFLRLNSGLETTGTFKHRKIELQKEGFDLSVVKDPVYLFLDGKYVVFSEELLSELRSGSLRL